MPTIKLDDSPFAGRTSTPPTSRSEPSECRHCGSQFAGRYKQADLSRRRHVDGAASMFATDLGHASLFATGRGPMVRGGGSRTDVPSAGGWHANEPEMTGERDEPLRIVKLGDTRLYITSVGFGKYLLHTSDGSLIAGPFTRVEAGQFAQDLLGWVREADNQD